MANTSLAAVRRSPPIGECEIHASYSENKNANGKWKVLRKSFYSESPSFHVSSGGSDATPAANRRQGHFFHTPMTIIRMMVNPCGVVLTGIGYRISGLDDEWQKRYKEHHTIGHHDELMAGVDASSQEGFSVGFRVSVLAGYNWGLVRGVSW